MATENEINNKIACEMTVDLLSTILFAAEKHKYQKRKGDGSSYIVHPLEVAKILAVEGEVSDFRTLQAAILHDTLEDTETTCSELMNEFGYEVAKIVQQVTDDKKLPVEVRKKLQIEHAAFITPEAKLVKMADKLHNCRDLASKPIWSLERTQGYFVWSSFVTRACAGVSEKMDLLLENFYATTRFTFEGKEYPVLPEGDLVEALENYFELMKNGSESSLTPPKDDLRIK